MARCGQKKLVAGVLLDLDLERIKSNQFLSEPKFTTLLHDEMLLKFSMKTGWSSAPTNGLLFTLLGRLS